MTSLTSDEIKILMVEARRVGALSFKYGDIQVEFGPKEDSERIEHVNPQTGLTKSQEADYFASSEG